MMAFTLVLTHVAHGCQEAVVKGVELGRAVGHEFVDDDIEEVGMVAGERREVHWQLLGKCRVEVDAEVALRASGCV